MAATDSSFEYFQARSENDNEPATSMHLGQNSSSVCCIFYLSFIVVVIPALTTWA
jgi:hypothetical protein